MASEQAGDRLLRPFFLACLAEAHQRLGEPEIGLELIEEAIETTAKSDGKLYEAELHRIHGRIFLKLGRADDAEFALKRALRTARERRARLWELRAATSLAEHWHNEGRRTEAYNLLEPVYAWFTEGFDTADLKMAKALLDELG